MEKYKGVVIAHSILLAICSIGCIIGLFTVNNTNYIVSVLMELLCVAASVMYLIKGYKKDAAKYYKLFMLLCAASFIVEYLPAIFNVESTPLANAVVLVDVILYGNYLLLGCAKDLGAKWSMRICGINVGVYVGFFVLGISSLSDISGNHVFQAVSLYAIYLLNAGITALMTSAKYIDKKSRDTK